MKMHCLSRRSALIGMVCLPGCTALNSLNQAAQPLDTFDLAPIDEGRGPSGRRVLLVLVPSAPAVIATDRILVRSGNLSAAYLPDGRWADDVPRMVQSRLIRSIASNGRFGFVGAVGSGPVPDLVLLTRIDQFGVETGTGNELTAQIAIELTLLRDRDQRIIASRMFKGSANPASDRSGAVASAFQEIVDVLLPDIANWVGTRGG